MTGAICGPWAKRCRAMPLYFCASGNLQHHSLDTAGATSWSDEVKAVLKPTTLVWSELRDGRMAVAQVIVTCYATPASLNRTNGIHMYGVFPLTWRLLMTDVNSVQESLAWRISSVAGY